MTKLNPSTGQGNKRGPSGSGNAAGSGKKQLAIGAGVILIAALLILASCSGWLQ